MSTDNKDMPAFPADSKSQDFGGLTKREYYAAMAMQGMCARGDHDFGQQHNAHISENAVSLADALLTELSK